MSNLLDAYKTHQNINNPSPIYKHTYTVNTEGKVKPLEDKGKLLPSRIFGSPKEYVKDLKKDIINIGRAANGKANDHELGRINDVALKLGSLAIACYLFVKNPLKLSKSMEFVGMGTFLGSMALWPKIALQAPIKARTGVDIHQKYIDSQGRKKMLFQDPQYDLTDLFSREDLDRMGRKLKVSKNLPDRDNFIKQRAKKTAVQGNTLWMLSAGLASPVMSALACNALETPLNTAFEKSALKTTEYALKGGFVSGIINKIRNFASERALMRYLKQNAGKEVTDEMLDKIVNELLPKVNSADLSDTIKTTLQSLTNRAKTQAPMTMESVLTSLKDIIPENFISSLNDGEKEMLNEALSKGSVKDIANTICDSLKRMGNISLRQKQGKVSEIEGKLIQNSSAKTVVTLDKITNQIKTLNNSLKEFVSGKKAIDDYIAARVGDNSGTYIANHWNRVCKKLFKTLKFNEKELKELQKGNMDVLIKKLQNLSKSDINNGFDSLISDLLKMTDDYEATAGNNFISTVQNSIKDVCSKAGEELNKENFNEIAERIYKNVSNKSGTVESNVSSYAAERALGAKSSIYRLIQALDVLNPANQSKLNDRIKSVYRAIKGFDPSPEAIEELSTAIKKVLVEATPTDYVEKLQTSKINVDTDEFRIISNIIFDKADDLIVVSGHPESKEALNGLNAYVKEMKTKVIDWKNSMTAELGRRVSKKGAETYGENAVERSNLIGKPVKDYIRETAEQMYNSKKWLKTFGIAMAVILGVTLIAGLFIGRKSKIEKELEKNKQNG